MSQNVRQNNLFAAEDFTKIYKSFKNVDFKAYDYDTIQQAMVDYLAAYYPESFNDFIESDEYVATIQLLAGIASSMAFRVDLNSRENFLDTAERRESIVRLAEMVNYQPKRNLAANGLFKIVGIQTSEPIKDSLGRSLENYTTFWNDPNNPNSYDQFITIMNAVLSDNNPFGKPYKQQVVSGISTSIYRLNNVTGSQVTYPTTITSNGESLPFDITNVDLNENGVLEEIHPDPDNAFSILYSNDGQGLDSTNTGFFFYFRQGRIEYKDHRFDFPIQSRVVPISTKNINETDVFVQEINDLGEVQEKWKKVPNANNGTNIIYNAINLSERNIYSVSSGLNDSINIVYSDGNFGEIPTGIFRTWYRTSANRRLVIRPEEAQGMSINIPYVGKDGQTYVSRFVFSLQYTVSNSSPSESNEQVKIRAPQVYYTQERMVNSEDYNVFPLTRGNEIAKIRAINRTHAGHSRYISTNDPTGFHQNIIVTGTDGAIFKDTQIPFEVVVIDGDINESNTITDINVGNIIKNHYLGNFFYEDVLAEYKQMKNDLYDGNVDTYNRYNVYEFVGDYFFRPYPDTKIDNTGYLHYSDVGHYVAVSEENEDNNDTLGMFKFFKVGAKVMFQGESSSDVLYATIKKIDDDGLTTFDINVPRDMNLKEIYPPFVTTLPESIKMEISDRILSRGNFALSYDIDSMSWYMLGNDTDGGYDAESDFDIRIPTQNWLVTAEYIHTKKNGAEIETYELRTRGTRFLFESYRDVRFYFDPNDYFFDQITQQYQRDTITITTENKKPVQKETWYYSGGAWVLADDSGVVYPANMILLKCRTLTNDDIVVDVSSTGTDVAASVPENTEGYLLISGVPADGDHIEITYKTLDIPLDEDVDWNIKDVYYQEDGYLDTSKVEIIPADRNEDGIPDRLFSFGELVSSEDLVFFENFTNFDGYTTSRIWLAPWLDLRGEGTIGDNSFTYDDILNNKLILVLESQESKTKEIIQNHVETSGNSSTANSINGKVLFIERRDSSNQIITENVDSKITLQKLSVSKDKDGNDIVSYQRDTDHFCRNGRSFSQNSNTTTNVNFYYVWDHVSPDDVRINPSISNILDMILLTNTYYLDVVTWKSKRGTLTDMPTPPSSEELRIQFDDFNEYKMMSDQIIFQPAKFKLLFGPQARPELRAKFKVVKLPNTTLSDNEIKSKIIDAVDIFFDIRNWDFGESFYYTELAAFIHQQVSNAISTVVIVPEYREANFGDLFQIKAEPNELFLSTATILDVQVVASLTNSNLRI